MYSKLLECSPLDQEVWVLNPGAGDLQVYSSADEGITIYNLYRFVSPNKLTLIRLSFA